MNVVSFSSGTGSQKTAPGSEATGLDPGLIAFFDSCADAVCVTDGDLDNGPRILYVNAAYTTLTGWSPEAIIGQTPRRLQGPRTDRARLKALKEALRAGETWRGEAINYRRDGSEFVMAWSITPATSAGGETRYVALQHDVSDQQISRLLLERRERQMMAAQRIARMGDWEYCGLRQLFTVSEAVAEILRLPAGQFSLSLEEFARRLDSDDNERVRAAFVSAARTQGAISLECRYIPADGGQAVQLRIEGAFGDPNDTGFDSAVGMISDISEQAKRTAELADRAKRLELAQRTASLGYWTLSPQTRRLTLSSDAAAIVGIDIETSGTADITLARWREAILAQDRAKVRGISAKMVKAVSATYRVGRPNGAVAWVHTVAEPEFDADGSPRIIRGIHQDVTALIEAQQAEQQAHAMLHEALDHAPDAILLLDEERRISAFNKALIDWYPQAASAIAVGAPFETIVRAMVDNGDYLIAGSRERWIADRLERLEHPSEHGWTQRMRDGRILEILERRTASGGYVSIRRDVTETRRTQDLLERRQKAMEASADGIAMTCPQGRFTFVNPAWAAQLGITREEMLGRHWTGFYDPSEIDAKWKSLTQTLRDYGRWRGELTAVGADGPGAEHEVSLTALEDAALIAVSRDVSARKADEREKQQLQRQFNEAQKMEAMGMMAGGIAHDFNNILSSILGYAGFLNEDLSAGGALQSYAQRIIDAGNRAKQLIGQILAFSRRQSGDRAPCDLRRVLTDNSAMLRASLPATIALSEHLPDEPILVDGNAGELGQVIMNLGANARDACDAGHGSLNLELATGYPEDFLIQDGDGAPQAGGLIGDLRLCEATDGWNRASIGELDEGQRVAILSVTDDGRGMDAATLRRVFEPFFTTKGPQRGTGLGLAAVYGIVSGHGGAVAVETAPQRGCRFYILLPLLFTDQTSMEGPQARPVPGEGRILVVDDEPMVRDTISVALSRLGYTVESFASAPPALERLREGQTPVDLIVTDQTMPAMTGLELAQAMRGHGITVPIIICSGFDSTLEQSNYNDLGITAFQQKPIDVCDLSEKIKFSLDKQP